MPILYTWRSRASSTSINEWKRCCSWFVGCAGPDSTRGRAITEQIDWRFWEIHAGQEDQDHRIRTRRVIDDIVGDEPDHLEDLKAGYLKGKTIFDEFWSVSDRRARMRA